jgi:neutral ceramidase
LAAYIDVSLKLIPYLRASGDLQPPPGPPPPDNTNRSLNFIPGVVYDRSPLFKKFGDVTTDVRTSIRRGTPAAAVFVGANPRNNLRQEKSYAVVERFMDDSSSALSPTASTLKGASTDLQSEESQDLRKERERDDLALKTQKRWQVVRDDSDWHLVFSWRRTSELLATSEVTITWETEEWAEPGLYRLRYFGDAKGLGGSITGFEGVSSDFLLV